MATTCFSLTHSLATIIPIIDFTIQEHLFHDTKLSQLTYHEDQGLSDKQSALDTSSNCPAPWNHDP